MNKIKNLEFLRVYLICAIIILHMFIDRKWCLCNIYPDITLYQNIKTAIAHSNNCVEGFFIIAGFLLYLTFKPEIKIKEFIAKKYIRLSPVIIFSIILCFLEFLLGVMKFDIIANFLTILLINQPGIKIVVGQNPILWFTSVLFAGLLLYFCLLKFIPAKFKTLTICTLVLFSYGILEILQSGSFANPLKNYYHIFNIGFLRAVGGVGLGCLIGHYKDFFINIKGKIWIYTLLEILCILFLFWWTIFPHKSLNNILFVINFAVLLVLFISRNGYISEFLNNEIWGSLGKYQYSIYVIHYIVIRIFGQTIWKNFPQFVHFNPLIPVILTLIFIILLGLFSYYVIELPCANYFKSKKQNIQK